MSPRAGASTASVLLTGGIVGLAAGAAGYLLARAAARSARPTLERNGTAMSASDREGEVVARSREIAARRLYAGSAALASSVFLDSGLEHYRGGLYNPLMYVAPASAALTLAASGAAGAGLAPRVPGRTPVFAAAVLTGLVGSGFHTYNISKREGGWRWHNLFHGAPLAAPMGLVFAGLFGLAADRLLRTGRAEPEILGLPFGKALVLGSAAGLLGTAAEAGLLHFRGAFHDPYMLLPVTIPPLSALALGRVLLAPDGARASAELALRTTEALGFAGVGFHAFGVRRNMGGWRNWSQNIQQGPPLPAPPSFTGMALAGRAGLALLEERPGSRPHEARFAPARTEARGEG
jgi:hypothetical protein